MSLVISNVLDYINEILALEAQKRNSAAITLNDKLGTEYISTAEQRIQSKAKIVSINYPLDISTSDTEYALPADVGDVNYIKIKQKWPDAKFTIEQRSTGKYIVFTDKGDDTTNFTIYYFPYIDDYTDDLMRDEADESLRPQLTLPDDAKDAIASWVIAKIYPDYLVVYEKDINELRATLAPNFDSGQNHNIGNIPNAET